MSFLDELHKGTNKASFTENGAITNTSTLSPLLDFFSRAGAMRGREAEALVLFQKAYAADPTNALRCLFYLRDIRGGQGERSVFRFILDSFDDEMVNKLVQFIPEYGRWDEVPITEKTADFIAEQLAEDEKNMKEGKPVSLLAKWLPSENTSSRETSRKANRLMKLLGLKPSQYRRTVVALRKHISLLEQKMSQKEWSAIQFDKIPSQAHKKHTKAFFRHEEERYRSYLGAVVKGEKKINVETLFTYQIYEMLKGWNVSKDTIQAANAMWQKLPDYTRGANALVLADVSGSMSGLPMSISVSLALYFAEHNEGPFKDYFMTFSSRPRLQKIEGSNLKERMDSIESSDWEMSTNIAAAFDAILTAAQSNNATADEIPRMLYIISDMEFDAATSRNDETNFEAAARKFKDAGYELPHLVFWNVNARGNQSPATKFDSRVTLISGSSQSTFKYAVEGKTPMESMMEILGSERYKAIEA